MLVTPAQSETQALQNVEAHLFSTCWSTKKRTGGRYNAGKATGDMFRTTPLWGVGQRRFFCMIEGPRTCWRRLKRTDRRDGLWGRRREESRRLLWTIGGEYGNTEIRGVVGGGQAGDSGFPADVVGAAKNRNNTIIFSCTADCFNLPCNFFGHWLIERLRWVWSSSTGIESGFGKRNGAAGNL